MRDYKKSHVIEINSKRQTSESSSYFTPAKMKRRWLIMNGCLRVHTSAGKTSRQGGSARLTT